MHPWLKAAKQVLVVLTLANVLGAIILITILEHYFSKCPRYMGKEHSNEVVQVLAVVLIGFGYSYFFSFYRTSARELKRLGECYFLPDWTYLF